MRNRKHKRSKHKISFLNVSIQINGLCINYHINAVSLNVSYKTLTHFFELISNGYFRISSDYGEISQDYFLRYLFPERCAEKMVILLF